MSVVVALALLAMLPTEAAVPAGAWELASDLTTCTITRQFVGRRSRYKVQIGTTISGSNLYLRIFQPGQQLSRTDLSDSPFVSVDGGDVGGGEGMAAVSAGSGLPAPTKYSWFQPGRRAERITSFTVQSAMLDVLAAGTHLAIDGISTPILTEVPPSRDAFQALKDCRQQRLDNWGLSGPTPDHVKLARLVADRSSAFDPSDLNAAIRRTAVNGRITLTVLVRADGMAERCFVRDSSNKDAASHDCLMNVVKLHWTAAANADGLPVASFYNIGVMLRR